MYSGYGIIPYFKNLVFYSIKNSSNCLFYCFPFFNEPQGYIFKPQCYIFCNKRSYVAYIGAQCFPRTRYISCPLIPFLSYPLYHPTNYLLKRLPEHPNMLSDGIPVLIQNPPYSYGSCNSCDSKSYRVSCKEHKSSSYAFYDGNNSTSNCDEQIKSS